MYITFFFGMVRIMLFRILHGFTRLNNELIHFLNNEIIISCSILTFINSKIAFIENDL